MELHPSGFVDNAGGCDGPNYIRSQPSRESAGVLLNQCESKYNPQMELPYKNVSRYLQEIQTSWNKLSPEDRNKIAQNVQQNLPMIGGRIETFKGTGDDATMNDFVAKEVAVDAQQNTQDLLNALYFGNDDLNQRLTETTMEKIRMGVQEWNNNMCLSYNLTPKVGIFVFLLVILFLLIGIAIGKNMNKTY